MRDTTNREIFPGGKLIFESGNQEQTDMGPCAFQMNSENSSGTKFNMGHYDNDMSKIDAEGTLQISCGDKNPERGTDFQLNTFNGDANITAEDGNITLKAETITLDAQRIVLKSNKIDVGDTSEFSCTSQLAISAQNIILKIGKQEIDLAKALKVSPLQRTFEGQLAGGAPELNNLTVV